MQRLAASYPYTPDERIAALAGLHDELEAHVLGAAPDGSAEEALRRARLEFDIYTAFTRGHPDVSYRDPARLARDTIECIAAAVPARTRSAARACASPRSTIVPRPISQTGGCAMA